MLISNRKDICENDWNKALVEAISTAFLDAVALFGDFMYTNLWYNWPLLLPLDASHDFGGKLFATVPHIVKTLCSGRRVLEDWNGERFTTREMILVQERGRSRKGKLLLPNEQTTEQLISRNYI